MSLAPDFDALYQRVPGLVLGFHGCDAEVGERLLRGEITQLAHSQNKYDWLGDGIYFWENDPLRAWEFAQRQHAKPSTSKGHVKTPFVIGAVTPSPVYRPTTACAAHSPKATACTKAQAFAPTTTFKLQCAALRASKGIFDQSKNRPISV